MIDLNLRDCTIKAGIRIAKVLQNDHQYPLNQERYNLLLDILTPRQTPPLHPLIEAKCPDESIISLLTELIGFISEHRRVSDLSDAENREFLMRLKGASDDFRTLISGEVQQDKLRYMIQPGLLADDLDTLENMHRAFEAKIESALNQTKQRQYQYQRRAENVMALGIHERIQKICGVKAIPLVLGVMNSRFARFMRDQDGPIDYEQIKKLVMRECSTKKPITPRA